MKIGSAALLQALAVIAAPGAALAEEAVKVKASSPDAEVNLLTAPHTGKTICALSDATPLTFFQRADHGPHKFAKVEVLAGDCAGKTGYISWFALDPKPKG